MCEEIFLAVLTIYVYPEDKFEETLSLVDTSPYATGAIFHDRDAIELATRKLVNAAGGGFISTISRPERW